MMLKEIVATGMAWPRGAAFVMALAPCILEKNGKGLSGFPISLLQIAPPGIILVAIVGSILRSILGSILGSIVGSIVGPILGTHVGAVSPSLVKPLCNGTFSHVHVSAQQVSNSTELGAASAADCYR